VKPLGRYVRFLPGMFVVVDTEGTNHRELLETPEGMADRLRRANKL
jgi:hypothetical protein